MEYKFKKGVKVTLPEGVEAAKFDANRVIASIPEEVLNLFESYGYNLEECPGVFLKIFNMTTLELKEVEENLKRIEELGLHSIFQANLQVRFFKNSFMKRLVECIKEGIPYLNPDNTFASFLVENKMEVQVEKESFPSQVTETEIASARIDYEANQEAPSEEELKQKIAQMTPEDTQVYNEIISRLNYLILANPMDNELAMVVNNASNKIIDAIIREEYKYLGMKEMVESVMFDGLEILPERNARITGLVSGALEEEERKLM